MPWFGVAGRSDKWSPMNFWVIIMGYDQAIVVKLLWIIIVEYDSLHHHKFHHHHPPRMFNTIFLNRDWSIRCALYSHRPADLLSPSVDTESNTVTFINRNTYLLFIFAVP